MGIHHLQLGALEYSEPVLKAGKQQYKLYSGIKQGIISDRLLYKPHELVKEMSSNNFIHIDHDLN